ncbi:hypothetical protein M3Y94_00062500 [Aphelenchoides besseyi]|nr:hypothetical protein M3Y94_00062500 [Aphelenchoides besseyi]
MARQRKAAIHGAYLLKTEVENDPAEDSEPNIISEMSNDELTSFLDAHDFYSLDEESLFKFIDGNDFSETDSSFLVYLFEMANETTTPNKDDEHYSSEDSDGDIARSLTRRAGGHNSLVTQHRQVHRHR